MLSNLPNLLLLDGACLGVVDSLRFEVTKTKEFGVCLGNGSGCSSRGLCGALEVIVWLYTFLIKCLCLGFGMA